MKKNLTNNQKYWLKRQSKIKNAQYKKAEQIEKELKKLYSEANNSIQKEINKFYVKYADTQGISLEQARKILTETELQDWEISLEEYKELAQYKENKAFLDDMYIRSRVSRLEALQTQVQAEIRVLGEQQEIKTKEVLKDVYKDTYQRTTHDIAENIGLVTRFDKLDNKELEHIVKKPFQGSNYSSRIWEDKSSLITELNNTIAQHIALGKSPSQLAEAFSKKMGTSYHKASRLLNTEVAHVTEQATFQGYKDTRVEEYEVLATLDERTSEICQEMDGQRFKLNEAQEGVNYPPFHPNCRTTTVPVTEFDKELNQERVAKDPVSGKNITINGNYSEYQKQIDKQYGEGTLQLERKKNLNRKNDEEQRNNYISAIGKREELETLEKFQDFKYNNNVDYDYMKSYYREYISGGFPDDMTFDIYKKNLTTDEWQAVGFNPKYIEKHKKHLKEFKGLKWAEYENKAKELLNNKDDGIERFVSKEGTHFAYNKKTNEFALARKNGITQSYYLPDEKEKYWKEQMEKYGK